MNPKKRGFALLMGAIYLTLSLGLLVSVTGARYTDQRTAYPQFKAAQFNAAIEIKDEGSTTEIYQVDISRMQPGMTLEADTALRIPFTVSNGPEEQYTAKVGIEYTIRIRTEKNLPLEFFLLQKQKGDAEAVTHTAIEVLPQETEPSEPQSTDPAEDEEPDDTQPSGEGEEPAPIDDTETTPDATTEPAPSDQTEPSATEPVQTEDQPWYEYTFVVTPQEGEVPQEATFQLNPEVLGMYDANDYELMIQWQPGTSGDIKYMKEVEILQILVTAHSINRLEEDMEYASIPTEPREDSHTPGILMLQEPAAGTVGTYEYKIDLRAFYGEPNAASRTFQFHVDNGVSHGMTQHKDEIAYDIQLKVPLAREESTGGKYAFRLLDLTYSFQEGTKLTVDHYRIYNEKTGLPSRTNDDGTPAQYDTLDAVNAEKLKDYEWVYAVYTVTSDVLKNWTTTTGGKSEPFADQKIYDLRISGTDLAKITDNVKKVDDNIHPDDLYSFHNKLELLIVARFQGDTHWNNQ